jgi:hypothetical protein
MQVSANQNNVLLRPQRGVNNKQVLISNSGFTTFYNTSGTVKNQIHTNGVSYFNGGNVGIGLTNPTYKLHVNGSFNCTSLYVNGAAVSGGSSVWTESSSIATYTGKTYIHNGNNLAAPSKATYGSSGQRIILWTGDSNSVPYGLGMNGSTIWYSCPASAVHKFYVGTSEVASFSSSKLQVNGGVLIGNTYTAVTSGPWNTSNAQLVLGGSHNAGFNTGTKAKLVITGYDNDGATIYPIYCEDENGKVDFYIKGAPSDGGIVKAHLRGDLTWGVNSKLKLDQSSWQTCGNIELTSGSGTFGFHATGGNTLGIYVDGNCQATSMTCNNALTVGGDVTISNSLYMASNTNQRIYANGHFYFMTNGSWRMFIHQTTGNVGINQTSPAQKLDVNGNAVIGDSGEEMFIGNVGHSGWAGIAHEDRANTTDYALIHNSNGHTLLNAKSNQNLEFRKGNGTVGYFNTSNHLVITNSCGIGNVNPGYKLDVNGDTRCRSKLYITTNGANIRSANQTYGTISVWGAAHGGWYGYSIQNWGALMANSAGNIGYHFNTGGWAWRSFNLNEGQIHEWYKNGNSRIMYLNASYFHLRNTRIYLHSTSNENVDLFQIFTNNAQGYWGLRFERHGTNNYNMLLRMRAVNGNEHTTGKFENDSGHTNNINNFTGQHRCISVNNLDATDMCGLIAYSTGKYMNIDNSTSPTIVESLPICDICTTDNDTRVFGVISDQKDDNEDVYYGYGAFKTLQKKTNKNEIRLYMNSVGEGAVWVCNKNGNIPNGDYITSCTIPGYGAKQADDILHNYSVAKITCECNFNLTKIVKQK